MNEYRTLTFNEFVAKFEKNLNKKTDKLSYLCEILDIFLNEVDNINKADVEKKNYIENKIKNKKNKNANSIVIAQINTIVGDISNNAKKIVNYIKSAKNINANMIVFPELALMGYPIFDTVERFPFLVDENIFYLNQIAKFTQNITAIIGFVEKKEDENVTFDKIYYNSFAILENGEIKSIVRKNCISFSIYKNDEILKEQQVFKANNLKYAILTEDNLSFKTKPEILLRIKAISTGCQKKEIEQRDLFFNLAKEYQVPLINVNKVGFQDDYLFEGVSQIYNENGEKIASLKHFKEQFYLYEFIKNKENKQKINLQDKSIKTFCDINQEFSLDYSKDLTRTYDGIKYAISEYFKQNKLKRSVLGLSGGLDSSVCACLLADAIGKENVYGVSMPSKITSEESKNDAKLLAKNLGINFIEIPIKSMVDELDKTFQPLFDNIAKNWQDVRYKKSYTMDNIQARSRATILWGISNEFEACIPIATSDKSELYMGYATINGDMSGGFAPIADVVKTKLFALARFMNEHRKEKNAIPISIINKKPGAELAIDEKTGKPLIAEDALMPYEFLDEVIWRIENKQECYFDMLNSTFLYEVKNNISKEQKQQWLKKFYTKMANAVFKWTLLPPSCIINSPSINKNDYHQSIFSNKINFCDFNTDEEIFKETTIILCKPLK